MTNLVLLVSLLVPFVLVTLAQAPPQWCAALQQEQKGTGFSHCSKHDINDPNDPLPLRSSWCSKTNYRANERISFKDPDFMNNCNNPSSHCIPPPNRIPTFINTPVCVDQDSSSNTDEFTFVTAGAVKGKVPTTPTNFTKRCYTAIHSIPFEITFSDHSTRQLLALSTNGALVVLDMSNEKLLLETEVGSGTLANMRVLAHPSVLNSAHIVGYSGANLVDFQLSFDTSKPVPYPLDVKPYNVLVSQFKKTFDVNLFRDPISKDRFAVFLTSEDSTASSPSHMTFYKLGVFDQTFRSIHFQLVLNSVPASPYYQIQPILQREYNRNSMPVKETCFPAKSERILLMLTTNRYVYMFAFMHNTMTLDSTSLNPDSALGKSLFFEADQGTEITASHAFGECFGYVATPSQQIWLVLGIKDRSVATAPKDNIKFFPLPELAQVDFDCALNNDQGWYAPASSRRANNCIRVTDACAQRTAAWFSTVCQARTPILTQPLVDASSVSIVTRLHTMNAGDTFMPTHLSFSYFTQVFVATTRGLDVFSFQESPCKDSSVNSPIIDQLQHALLLDPIFNLAVSNNGQHVFATTYKREWELLNRDRLLEICTLLSNKTTTLNLEIFSRYQDACNKNPSKFALYDYVTYMSQCYDKFYCPRFGLTTTNGQFVVESSTVGPGNHVIRPIKKYTCEQGFFCPGIGNARRQKCPAGSKCPNVGMQVPIACTVSQGMSTACVDEGLIQESMCPLGYICNDPLEPTPAPPGFYVSHGDRRLLSQCELGTYCPLATTNETAFGGTIRFYCPVGAYCDNPQELQPTSCLSSTQGNDTLYCPLGTYRQFPCPPQFECPTPTEINMCEDGYYCPAGTRKKTTCPAGNYCPNPSSYLICPYGFYCVEGTTNPVKCQYLVICPTGTSRPQYAVGAILIDIGLLVLALVGFIVIRLIQRSRNKKRHKSRQSKEEKKKEQQAISASAPTLDDNQMQTGFLEIEPMLETNTETQMVYSLEKKAYTMELELADVSLIRKKTNKVMFAGLNARIFPGKVTAILADDPSLGLAVLRTFAGRNWDGHLDGTILVNGAAEKTLDKFQNIFSYVPEGCVTQTDFRVGELLRFVAHQRLPSNTTFSQVNEKVKLILDVFNLKEYANHEVGKLSRFGFDTVQRRLVNIAAETVTEPNALFLEFPTSHLDSNNSRRILRVLKDIAEAGTTVVAVVNRLPFEIFKLFDDALIVSEKAGIVYNGATSGILQYFEEIGFRLPMHVNPVDYVVDICMGQVPRPGDLTFKPGNLSAFWDAKRAEKAKPWSPRPLPHSNQEEGDTNLTGNDAYERQFLSKEREREMKRDRMGVFGQYFLFTVRSLLENVYHIKGLLFDFLFTFVVASTVGTFFLNTEFVGPLGEADQAQCPAFIRTALCSLPRRDNIGALMLFTTTTMAIVASYTSIKPYGQYMSLYKREVQNGMNKLSYFLGKMTAHIPYNLILPLIFLSSWYLLIAPRVSIFLYYWIFLLVWLVWTGFGYLVSIALPRLHSMFFAVMFILGSAMISGFQPTVQTWLQYKYVAALVYISPMRWALELFFVKELEQYESDGVDTSSALQYYGFSSRNVPWAVCVLCAYAIVFRLLAYLVLYFKDPVAMERVRTLIRVFIRKGKDKLKIFKARQSKSKQQFVDPLSLVAPSSSSIQEQPLLLHERSESQQE